MTSTENIAALISEFDTSMDLLESCLAPVKFNNIISFTENMTPIDKAKTYVALLYALNSSIFSALKLDDLFTDTHPVMTDIKRVQTYMAKVKHAEELVAGRQLQLDRSAAGRFIKHALSGNETYDEQRNKKRTKGASLTSTIETSENISNAEDESSTVAKETAADHFVQYDQNEPVKAAVDSGVDEKTKKKSKSKKKRRLI
ncbi:uncharacterized protein V1518DRAFT_29867 [Limtongia smithiae]|uniref:uncharacterized protein n=1 Tax=Limtongia smithiae TaxID=1125753 RepID=UPI0034CEBA27